MEDTKNTGAAVSSSEQNAGDSAKRSWYTPGVPRWCVSCEKMVVLERTESGYECPNCGHQYKA